MPHRRPTFHVPPPPDGAPARAPGDPPRGGVRLPCPVPEGREQYLSDWCEERRLSLLADKASEWSRRAREATTESRFTYAANRSAALRRRLRSRISQCSTVHYTLRCAGGRLATMPRPCRQWWVCRRCRLRRSHQLRQRIIHGLGLAWERSTAGGMRRALRLSTLTVRHRGTFAEMVDRLARAWRTFYKRTREWLGAFPYVGVWEVTPGRDGLGHPHLHVAWIGPRFVPYGKLLGLWRRAIGDVGARINHVASNGTVARCANYLGKYLSKGVELSGFNDELRADTLATFYNRHLVLTSHKFWGPRLCDCCQSPWRRWYGPGGVLPHDPELPGAVRIGGAPSGGGGAPPSLFGETRSAAGPRCR